MGNILEIDKAFKLYLNADEYVKVVRNDFWFILRRNDFEYFRNSQYAILGELWRFSTYVLNIIGDEYAVMEKNRWGKQDFWMLLGNIKFGKIICKLTRK